MAVYYINYINHLLGEIRIIWGENRGRKTSQQHAKIHARLSQPQKRYYKYPNSLPGFEYLTQSFQSGAQTSLHSFKKSSRKGAPDFISILRLLVSAVVLKNEPLACPCYSNWNPPQMLCQTMKRMHYRPPPADSLSESHLEVSHNIFHPGRSVDVGTNLVWCGYVRNRRCLYMRYQAENNGASCVYRRARCRIFTAPHEMVMQSISTRTQWQQKYFTIYQTIWRT